MTELINAAILGLGVGGLYALSSLGLIVIYRGSGILNFAQGAVGLAAAYLWWELDFNHGWPFWAASLVAVVAAAIVGALIHILLIRNLRNASPLARTVATLALLITIQSAIAFRYGAEATVVPSSLPTTAYSFGAIFVPSARLILIAIAVLMSVVLWIGYRFTSFGVSTSAVAESQRSASSLGISPDRIAATNWALGSALGAVAAILVAPILTLQVSSMTSLLLAALAAALIAGFRSFPLTLFASLVIGLVQAVTANYSTSPGLAQSIPFIAIVLVMIVRGKAIPLRDFLLERLPSVGSGRIRLVFVVPAVVGACVLISTSDQDWTNAISTTLAAGVVMLSVVVISGYAGQLSLTQYGLAGFGALISGRLAVTTGIPVWLTVAIGVAATILLGLIFALPAIRTRGINLAIITLGLGSALEVMVFDNTGATGGAAGTAVKPDLFGINVDSNAYPARYGFLVLACFVVAALIVANLRRSRLGRRMVAVRTNERAAAALGVNAWSIKLWAFGLSAGIAALGGILLADQHVNIDYTTFTSFNSVTYTGFAFLGGIGYVLGPLFGAVFVPGTVGTVFGDTIFSDIERWAALIGGIGLILGLLANQDGVAHGITLQFRWIGRQIGKLLPARVRGFFTRSRIPAWQDLQAAESARVVPRTLRVEELTVQYGTVVALDHVSLTVRPGEVFGLIGPNGAGKTSLIDGVTGFAPSSGQVWIDDHNVSRLRPYARARRGLSRSFQSLELFEDLTVYENLQTASDASRSRLTYLVELVRPFKSALPAEVVAAVKLFGLQGVLNSVVSDLPYGQRRLVAIARAVALQPSILMLDEPAAGLSETETSELGSLARRLADDWGMAVLVIEHDTKFVMDTCDHVLVLDFGKRISEGAPAEVRQNADVIAAYLGGATVDVEDPQLAEG